MAIYNIIHGPEFWLAWAIFCAGAMAATIWWFIVWRIDIHRSKHDRETDL